MNLRFRSPPVILTGIGLIVVMGLALLQARATGETNHVALASEAKGVTVVVSLAAKYRPSHRFVGSVQPWMMARVGPQLLSAYVDTVLVRPGDVVKRGAVLATLDCKVASNSSASVAAQARALQERQQGLATEAARLEQLSKGGFVAANELDQKQANMRSAEASVDALKAQLAGKSLEVQDCTMRAPFDGEIGERMMDPGSFARPGSTIATVVDRHLMRVVADAPEIDASGLLDKMPVQVHLLASNLDLAASLSRRAPSADPSTRTVHFEVDLDPTLLGPAGVPAGTTAEIHADFGIPQDATEIPLTAAKVRGQKATVFVLEGDVVHAKAVRVIGERGGSLFVDRSLAPGTSVVSEGRSKLVEGDHVVAKIVPPSSPTASDGGTP